MSVCMRYMGVRCTSCVPVLVSYLMHTAIYLTSTVDGTGPAPGAFIRQPITASNWNSVRTCNMVFPRVIDPHPR